VRVQARGGDNGQWRIHVRDTGIGIPHTAQEQIFEPFRQVDESITRKYGGFGLGLSIVKHMTALMDGDIALESEEGKGSCFTVTLPVSLLGSAKTKPFEQKIEPSDPPAATHPLIEGVVLKS
jgi:signal transduction histidine kinase